MEFGYYIRLLYVGDPSGRFMMMSMMPLQVCDLGCISCMYMLPSKNRALFGINFFVSLFGATLAVLLPQFVLKDVGPDHFRYYEFFGAHLGPIVGTIYMMMVHGMRPRYRDIWYTVGSLELMMLPAVKVNKAFPGADRLFLEMDLPFFPKNQYLRALIYSVLIIALFHAMLYSWRWFERAWSRRRKKNKVSISDLA